MFDLNNQNELNTLYNLTQCYGFLYSYPIDDNISKWENWWNNEKFEFFKNFVTDVSILDKINPINLFSIKNKMLDQKNIEYTLHELRNLFLLNRKNFQNKIGILLDPIKKENEILNNNHNKNDDQKSDFYYSRIGLDSILFDTVKINDKKIS